MAMVVTDLDGTLLDGRSSLGEANRRALERLGEAGCVRVVATGRSLYSAEQVLDAAFPIDYLVFSSGAGIVDWRSRELLAVNEMPMHHARGALERLLAKNMACMVHLGVPDNHHFYYHPPDGTGAEANPDFHRRCQRYAQFAQPLQDPTLDGLRVTQLLAIEAPGSSSHYDALVSELAHLNVVLTTSPLDHQSRWIEIFSPAASKSGAAEWLRRRHGVAHDQVVAIGNDFNDRDLLDWADHSFVVANAAAALKDCYTVVASNDEQGFAQALAARGLLLTGREK